VVDHRAQVARLPVRLPQQRVQERVRRQVMLVLRSGATPGVGLLVQAGGAAVAVRQVVQIRLDKSAVNSSNSSALWEAARFTTCGCRMRCNNRDNRPRIRELGS
jgi:hypothetical protein